MKLVPINPQELPNFREAHRGRVSYPILKQFLECPHVMVRIDRTGMQQNMQALNSSLTTYVRTHDLPIKVFRRQGEMYLLRLDKNNDGSENPDWRIQRDQNRRTPSEPITFDGDDEEEEINDTAIERHSTVLPE